MAAVLSRAAQIAHHRPDRCFARRSVKGIHQAEGQTIRLRPAQSLALAVVGAVMKEGRYESTQGMTRFHQSTATIRNPLLPFMKGSDRPILLKKVGFSVRLNSGMTTIGEPTHHIEWFLGPSLTCAARLLG